ncbi:solute carrier family 49 member 4 homolog isoform X1 [Branchiostoma floridae x Branchiostoma belcheri]
MDTRSRDRRTSSATEYDPLLNRIRTDSYASGMTTNGYSVNATKTSQGQWRVYKRRWYILVLFSLVCFDQSVVLNTWSPISDSAKLVFGWKDGDISLLSNWGSITFVGLALVGPWVIQSLGLRVTMVGTAVLVLAGSGLRCITTRTPAATWLIHTGQFLDGLAGIITMAAPPVVSSVWFPPEQRTLATGINVFISYMGYAVAFVIGPLVVTQPTNSTNQTVGNLVNGCHPEDNGTDPCFVQMNAEQILRLMYIETSFAGLLCLAVVLYFPSKPATPPSTSASTERINLKESFLPVIRNGQLLLLVLCSGITNGAFGGWGMVLDVSLSPHGIHQIEAGWLGFYMLVSGCFASLFFSWLSDRCAGRMKTILFMLYVGAALSTAWLTLMLWHGVIPFNTVSLYVSIILSGLFVNGAVPLFYEMAAEITYPIPEAVSSTVLIWSNCFFAGIFLLIPMIPGVGTLWMTWCILGAFLLSLPLLMFLRGNYQRLRVDQGQPNPVQHN